MKPFAAFLLMALTTASPEIRYFHHQRPLQNTAQHPTQACLSLDPAIFSHAGPQLADLRLYRGTRETPYAIHLAESAAVVPDFQTSMAPLNLGQQNGQTTFDAELPESHYSDLQLNISTQNFIATVTVSGSRTQSGTSATKLGEYTVFDLTGQRLGRSTVLHLPESDFPYLHFRVTSPLKPENITSLSIERLPTTQPRYTQVAESAQVTQNGHTSVLQFTVPANTPVDQITFTPGPQPTNFNRSVDVDVAPLVPSTHDNGAGSANHIVSGNLLRIHATQNSHRIDEEHLTVDAPSTLSTISTHWTITIQNGDDLPINLASVQLQMLERTLCFEATPQTKYTLLYGDPNLESPHYDYATLFTPQTDALKMTTSPEQPNPQYQSRPDTRPFTEKHPALLWIALIAVIALLGTITLRSTKPKPAS